MTGNRTGDGDKAGDGLTWLTPAILYTALLMLMGACGNTLVCYVYGFRWQRTVTKIFIFSLAALDLMNSVICMPTEIAMLVKILTFDAPEWCKITRFLTYTLNGSSSLILVAIAMDRYNKIHKPLSPFFTDRRAKYTCIGAVFFAVSLSWPSLVFYGNLTIPIAGSDAVGVTCLVSDDYIDTWWPLAFYSVYFACYLGLVVAITVLYSLIARRLVELKKRQVERLKLTASGGVRTSAALPQPDNLPLTIFVDYDNDNEKNSCSPDAPSTRQSGGCNGAKWVKESDIKNMSEDQIVSLASEDVIRPIRRSRKSKSKRKVRETENMTSTNDAENGDRRPATSDAVTPFDSEMAAKDNTASSNDVKETEIQQNDVIALQSQACTNVCAQTVSTTDADLNKLQTENSRRRSVTFKISLSVCDSQPTDQNSCEKATESNSITEKNVTSEKPSQTQNSEHTTLDEECDSTNVDKDEKTLEKASKIENSSNKSPQHGSLSECSQEQTGNSNTLQEDNGEAEGYTRDMEALMFQKRVRKIIGIFEPELRDDRKLLDPATDSTSEMAEKSDFPTDVSKGEGDWMDTERRGECYGNGDSEQRFLGSIEARADKLGPRLIPGIDAEGASLMNNAEDNEEKGIDAYISSHGTARQKGNIKSRSGSYSQPEHILKPKQLTDIIGDNAANFSSTDKLLVPNESGLCSRNSLLMPGGGYPGGHTPTSRLPTPAGTPDPFAADNRPVRLSSALLLDRLSKKMAYRPAKTTRMLFAISIVFIVSFLPFFIIVLMRAVQGTALLMSLSDVEVVIVNIFIRSSFISNAANPVIYGLCNKQFRLECKQLFGRFSGRQSDVRMRVIEQTDDALAPGNSN